MTTATSTTEQMTGTVETYNTFLRVYNAKRTPAPGLIKRYEGSEYDDFGNLCQVFISSSEYVTDGQITWQQTTLAK